MKCFICKTIIYYFPLILCCFWGYYATGEIGRLSGIPFGKYQPNFIYPDTSYCHSFANIRNIKSEEIFVIGDSYSLNPNHAWYQLYSEKNSGRYMRTFNWTNKDLNQISLASVLIESGALDSCKVMIIENVERRLVDNLLNYKSQTKSYDINFLKSLSDTNHITSHPYSSHPHVESLKHIANSVRFGLGLKKTEMIAMDLCSEFFSSKRFSNKLIFRQEELNFMHHDPAMIITSIDIMNKLHEEALSRGIFLIFMVAAGSFDLYQDYIVDNPYPKDTTLDYFDDLDTTWFLNTKKLIKPYIDAGEKDMVLLNDTHWSIKSAKLAGEKLGEMIKEYYDSSRK